MEKFITKKCKTHGLTEFVLEGRGTYRCRTCRSEAVTTKRRRNKEKLVNSFGGCCVRCGYNKSAYALQFHHKDPSTKSFGIGSSTGMSRAYSLLEAEAKKCILLCANCHAEEHAC